MLVSKVDMILDYWLGQMDGATYPEEVVIMMLENRFPERRLEITGGDDGFGNYYLIITCRMRRM